ncbi:hypothetical protein G6011_00958 [Alternaria panax]|uniref:Uncharacterized protein n=1 Tax=Alternaria panax TaxID=48097 RepID=A0AAD4IJ25_9PLEO|nr:hypothetical protein G6011_00958 [Alternaria panax]
MTLMGVGGNLCTKVFSTRIKAYNPTELYSSSQNSLREIVTYFASLDRNTTNNATILSSGTMTMAPMIVYWQKSNLETFDPEYAATIADHLSIAFMPTSTADVTAETAAPPD